MFWQFLSIAAFVSTSHGQDIRFLLQSQDFKPPLDLEHSEISYVGDITQREHRYSIYLYYGTNPESLHGINRLIVILNGKTYLGDYDSSLTDRCWIKGQSIVCDNESGYGRVVSFTKNGPPLHTNIDGMFVDFEFGPRLKKRPFRSR